MKHYIEDVDPILRDMWKEYRNSNNNTWFIEEDFEPWEDYDITREEYENRIDNAIKEYNLENIIVKGEDDAMYTVYGDFLKCFKTRSDRK